MPNLYIPGFLSRLRQRMIRYLIPNVRKAFILSLLRSSLVSDFSHDSDCHVAQSVDIPFTQ